MIRNIATDEKIFPDQTTDWEKISLMYMLPCWFEMTQGICWVFSLFQQENKNPHYRHNIWTYKIFNNTVVLANILKKKNPVSYQMNWDHATKTYKLLFLVFFVLCIMNRDCIMGMRVHHLWERPHTAGFLSSHIPDPSSSSSNHQGSGSTSLSFLLYNHS